MKLFSVSFSSLGYLVSESYFEKRVTERLYYDDLGIGEKISCCYWTLFLLWAGSICGRGIP